MSQACETCFDNKTTQDGAEECSIFSPQDHRPTNTIVSKHFSDIEMEHIRVFAVEIYFLLPAIIKKTCNGCQIDHPSQIEHDVCVKLTKEEMVELCFHKALRKIDINRSILLLKRLIPKNGESHIFTEHWNQDQIRLE